MLGRVRRAPVTCERFGFSVAQRHRLRRVAQALATLLVAAGQRRIPREIGIARKLGQTLLGQHELLTSTVERPLRAFRRDPEVREARALARSRVKTAVLSVLDADRLETVANGTVTVELHHAEADAARALELVGLHVSRDLQGDTVDGCHHLHAR